MRHEVRLWRHGQVGREEPRRGFLTTGSDGLATLVLSGYPRAYAPDDLPSEHVLCVVGLDGEEAERVEEQAERAGFRVLTPAR